MKGRQGFVAPRRVDLQAEATEATVGVKRAPGDLDSGQPPKHSVPATTQPPARAPLTSIPNNNTGAYGSCPSIPSKRPFLATKSAPSKAARLEGPTTAGATEPTQASASGPAIVEVHAVLYTKKDLLAKKKASKKFADGVVTTFEDGSAMLYDQDGEDGPYVTGTQDSKVVTKGRFKRFGSVENGDHVFEIGNWHAETDRQLTPADFRSGACFMSNTGPSTTTAAAKPDASGGLRKAAPFKAHVPAAGAAGKARAATGDGAAGAAAVPAAGLYDPAAPGAVVVNAAQWDGGRGRLRDGRPVTPVVIDPYIGRHLRPHQEEGVRFMYEAVMGLTTPDKTGCILADEMGLGKTLQVITLSWTLLRQGPEGRPVAAKVLVVTPATLVDNWGREVKKWLGSERLQTLCLQQSSTAKQQILEFRHGCHQRMMITSYETLRKHAAELRGAFDLLVCDEGHRLKSVGGNKTIDALLSLGCQRRILLTGTPVQNDLKEFYALLSFVAPEVLGTPAAFNRVYGLPITRSQEATATAEERELGAARASDLQAKVSVFILRRTQALLAKHLPPLTSLTLFCKPSDQQVGLYTAVLRSKAVASLLYGAGGGSGEDNTLAIITALRKVANHPDLMLDPSGEAADADGQGANRGCAAPSSSCLPSFNQQFTATGSLEAAGKMQVLSVLLSAIAARGERCVVVSTSTATLDLVGHMVCKPQGLTTVRIDGATSVDGRQTVVDNFNKLGMGQVFLLSTRAGGAGLNLVGACHLVLYDSDWNPAMDQQAMARIWRDGQTKPCFVYRLLTTGTIEEKVYQRQLMKADLASATVAGGSGAGGSKGGGKFTREELRQLFSLNTATASDTRDLLPQGKVAGLRWVETEQVPQDGSALAAAAASGFVTCLNHMETTAMAGAATGGGSAGATCPGAPQSEEEVAGARPCQSDVEDNDPGCGGAADMEEEADGGDDAAEDAGAAPEPEGGVARGSEEGAAGGRAGQGDGVDCLDVLEDW